MIQTILPIISTVVDRLIPDTHANAKAKLEIEKALIENATAINMAQSETNKIEAGHKNIFVAGWRPFLGWTAGFGFAWVFVFAPLIQWLLILNNVDVALPTFHTDVLLELTMAMLGLAGLRSFEKLKGLTK